MSSAEFKLIERYFARPVHAQQGVVLGIGDDAALLNVPAGMELAVSVDTLLAGVHFPENTQAADIGHKALAVNLSDMAAMGAEPRWATLALTLPKIDTAWLEGFSAGFFALAERYKVTLIGGDTTRGPLSITVQMHGLVPVGLALRRASARPGDLIYVTGELGDAGLALRALQGTLDLPAEHKAQLLERLNRPEPRIAAGLALRGIASAAIDISDGLAADLGHILSASKVGATLHLERLPLSADVSSFVIKGGDWNLPLSAGDDYELCFTVPARNEIKLRAVLDRLMCTCTPIGMIEEAPGLRCELADGKSFTPDSAGYDHFA
ncbi:MAG: thiamine-phosphate kinase [Gammaproteobacteria bacterium]